MKKIMEKEVTICDECGKEEYVEACLGCGIEHCNKCRKKCGVEYEHAVHISGSGDGYFCHECDIHPPTNIRKLHQAYLNIRKLREESEEWYVNFGKHQKEAEAALEALQQIY